MSKSFVGNIIFRQYQAHLIVCRKMVSSIVISAQLTFNYCLLAYLRQSRVGFFLPLDQLKKNIFESIILVLGFDMTR